MGKNNRVLVLDDDKQLLEVYCEVLNPKEIKSSALKAFAGDDIDESQENKKQFFDVVTVDQGELGVEAVRQSIEENKPYAMAFVDIRMPPGIDGLEAARRMRDIDDRIYIVIVTAYSDRSIDEINDSLVHDVVFTRKPLTKDEIFQLARNACMSWEKDEELRSMRNIMEQRLEENQIVREYFENLVSSLTEGLLVCTASGMITSINPACAKISEYKEENLLGMSLDTLFPDGGVGDLIQKIIREGPQEHSADLLTNSGNHAAVILSGSVIHNKKNSMINKKEQSVVLVVRSAN
ncbi:MAG: response regulator [Magnetococcales bacterium]|nr:response regulator [Magnetococcales bacterium]